MGEGTFRIPGAAWVHRFDEPLDAVRGPSRLMSIGAALKMLPMILRMGLYMRRAQDGGFDPLNVSLPTFPGPFQGVPLGGIGGGSIGRGWRGDFRRWQLKPGAILNPSVMADQFTLYVQPDGQPGRTQVLFPGRPVDGSLSSWRWDLPPAGARYQALFPRAWTSYDEPLPGVRLTCRQLSPVIAHNYQESSYPVSEFRWQIENTGPLRARVGLMFTFQNGMGAPGDSAGGHANLPFEQDGYTGVLLRHNYQQQQTVDPNRKDRKRAERAVYNDPLAFAIAARCEPGCGGQVSYRACFNPQGDGAEVWADLVSDGRLDNLADPRPSAPGETICAALAATVEVPPGEAREVAFALAWDMPVARMGGGAAYERRYTCFYPVNGAVQLAAEVLRHADDWEAQIEAWQNPILEDAALPDWYRGALFNELYYLVDGGTVWGQSPGNPAPDAEMGHFAYLEGHEYRFLNTYDVHFYSSFALAQNWPKLELALQRDIAAATLAEYPTQFTEMYTGRRAPRKQSGAVPHDIGQAYEDPWTLANAYFLHNVNDWKDLNAKFVLQVYRDYLVTGDLGFVHDTWEAVEAAIRRLHRFDRDGDGLIENDGYPDQTYDLWPVKGPSAYTGGLWLACLTAGAALADLNSEGELAYEYRKMFARGKKAYAAYLWNGSYFNYDSSSSRQHDSIMADQLAGQWYAQACGLPPIAPPENIRSALQTVFEWNVQRFADGRLGAVNGMRPDGRVDRSCIQSQEVWTGSSYAAAAAMIQEGLVEAGFATAQGVAHTTYHDSGYWFQTPEAWDSEGNYRSIAYMRPLAIWAMQWAWKNRE